MRCSSFGGRLTLTLSLEAGGDDYLFTALKRERRTGLSFTSSLHRDKVSKRCIITYQVSLDLSGEGD
jgi:hypothetical protein